MASDAHLLWADTEIFSECDLRKAGAHRYAEDPTTEVLLFPYALGSGQVQLWDSTGGVDRPEVCHELEALGVDLSCVHGGPMPAELRQVLTDPAVRLVFHNAAFDMQLVNTTLGFALPAGDFLPGNNPWFA